jgi:hypothetical protein
MRCLRRVVCQHQDEQGYRRQIEPEWAAIPNMAPGVCPTIHSLCGRNCLNGKESGFTRLVCLADVVRAAVVQRTTINRRQRIGRYSRRQSMPHSSHGPVPSDAFPGAAISDSSGRGLSQERLAFDAAVDRSYVGGLERQEEKPNCRRSRSPCPDARYPHPEFLWSQPRGPP